MNIAQKLSYLLLGVFVVVAVLSTAFVYQMKAAFERYDAVFSDPVREMDQARVIQVAFKKQVQEWKDILLRGQNDEDLVKYTRNFHDDERQVRTEAAALLGQAQDPKVRSLLGQFLAAHQTMSARYQASYDVYTRDFDFKNADRMVRGQDRAPTDLFDAVVRRLDLDAQASIQEQQASSRRYVRTALSLSAVVLGALGLAGFVTVRNVLRRIGKLKTIADRLSLADVNGLCVDVSGEDEIGRFGESMKGVHAAIEELLSISNAPAHL